MDYEAIGASGLRTVVFKVAGTIESSYTISNDYLTIAGQTAPGGGRIFSEEVEKCEFECFAG